jgi:hypothetical protein
MPDSNGTRIGKWSEQEVLDRIETQRRRRLVCATSR